jgi:hypothetical protein
MESKRLKKQVKRNTAKRRAKRQTARRAGRLCTIRNKGQVAQDLYVLQSQSSVVKNGRWAPGQYKLSKYDFGMFKYGEPVPAGEKPSSKAKRKRETRVGKKSQRTANKDEFKRTAKWASDVTDRMQKQKKILRQERNKRKSQQVRRLKNPTSRKLKQS